MNPKLKSRSDRYKRVEKGFMATSLKTDKFLNNPNKFLTPSVILVNEHCAGWLENILSNVSCFANMDFEI